MAEEFTNKIDPHPGESIPTEEIKKMVDILINIAKTYPPNNAIHQACLTRAGHYMDLVDSWRRSKRPYAAEQTHGQR